MGRLDILCANLPEGVDAALIASPHNRRYYLDFRSSAGVLLAGRERRVFIVDSRYFEAAQTTVRDCEVVLQGKLYEQLARYAREMGVKTLAIESDEVRVRTLTEYEMRLQDVELVADDALSDLIRAQRQRKDDAEIERMKRAQALTDRSFAHILDYIQPGRTEREIALELEFFSRREGSQGNSFDFIVVSGKNSSLPHGEPSDKPVERGDFITMDFGCIADGYCADMTRTVAVGEVSDEQRKVYDTVLRAQLAALEAIRPGVPCREVDGVARGIIDGAGYPGCFGHGLGHSLGLEVHEHPAFNPIDTTVLEEGMVLSVEPGIYLSGRFGVRIEDVMVVTEDGCENLTASPKELLIL